MDLLRLRDIGGLSISPDGNWAAFQIRQADAVRNQYDMAWHVVETDGSGVAHHLADAGEPIQPTYLGRIVGYISVPPPAWSPDGLWLTYLRKDAGSIQIWRTRRDGRRTEQLTHNDALVRSLAYSRDGRRILFETELSATQLANALSQEGRQGFLYDRRFYPSYSPLPAMPTDVAFGRSDGITADQRNVKRLWTYELSTRRERPATKDEQTEFAAGEAGPRPNDGPANFYFSSASSRGAIAWTDARDPRRQGGMAPLTLVAQLTDTATPIVCNAPECTSQTMRGLWWRNDTEIVFARGEGILSQNTAFYGWRPSDGTVRRILHTPNLVTITDGPSDQPCSIAHDRLVCFYEEANAPRRLVTLDLDTGHVDTLHDPNPEFSRFQLGALPQRLVVRSPSGLETSGQLVLPSNVASHQRLPLLIVTYRCQGFLRGGTGDEYPIFPSVAHGFAVFCFDIPTHDLERLATEDWVAYGNWSRGKGDPIKHRIQEALVASIQHLDSVGLIDPDRVALTGLSYGAETVSFALFSTKRPLAAAIASGAGYEPMGYYLSGIAARETIRSWGLAAPDVTAGRWRGFSLSPNARLVRAPLLLNVGEHEMLSALQPVTALEDVGRAVEMYVFPDEYHIKSQPAHRLAIYERNIDWMNFWLQGREDPAPEKAEQYTRWRAMRVKQCELFGKEPDPPWYCRDGALAK